MTQSQRSEGARPVPGLIKHGHVGKPIGGNTPVRVNPTNQSPDWYVGCLVMTFASGDYTGTGTLIGKKYVLTCAHNLYDRNDGGEATAVYFERALNGNQQHYERVKAKNLFYPDGYRQIGLSPRHLVTLAAAPNAELLAASWDLDYGLVELESGFDLSAVPELAAKTDDELLNHDVTIRGYPGEAPYPGDEMFKGSGKITAVTATELQYPITTTKGNSGSAVAIEDLKKIVGIHTHSGAGDYNCARRLTADVIAQIARWMPG